MSVLVKTTYFAIVFGLLFSCNGEEKVGIVNFDEQANRVLNAAIRHGKNKSACTNRGDSEYWDVHEVVDESTPPQISLTRTGNANHPYRGTIVFFQEVIFKSGPTLESCENSIASKKYEKVVLEYNYHDGIWTLDLNRSKNIPAGTI